MRLEMFVEEGRVVVALGGCSAQSQTVGIKKERTRKVKGFG